jgi:hypothetical protein
MSFQLNEPGQHMHEVIAFDTPLTVGVNSKKVMISLSLNHSKFSS